MQSFFARRHFHGHRLWYIRNALQNFKSLRFFRPLEARKNAPNLRHSKTYIFQIPDNYIVLNNVIACPLVIAVRPCRPTSNRTAFKRK